MSNFRKCSRCHSEVLDEFFSKNRKGELKKCCNNCLNRFKCVKCDYKCSTKGHLTRHVKAVHDKIQDVECKTCDYKCSDNSNLARHIKQVHDKIKDFECPTCDYKCSTNGHLKKHIKGVHDRIQDIECKKCDYKCSENGSLTRHIKRVHDKIKDFKCPTCPYKSSTNVDLKTHIKTCTGEINCSSGELAVMKALDKLNTPYIYDQSYDNLKDKSYLRWDFRIDTGDSPVFIEYDGKFHYFPIKKSREMTQEQAEDNLKTIQKRDKIKDDYCNDNGFLLLRIPYWDKANVESLVSDFINKN